MGMVTMTPQQEEAQKAAAEAEAMKAAADAYVQRKTEELEAATAGAFSSLRRLGAVRDHVLGATRAAPPAPVTPLVAGADAKVSDSARFEMERCLDVEFARETEAGLKWPEGEPWHEVLYAVHSEHAIDVARALTLKCESIDALLALTRHIALFKPGGADRATTPAGMAATFCEQLAAQLPDRATAAKFLHGVAAVADELGLRVPLADMAGGEETNEAATAAED